MTRRTFQRAGEAERRKDLIAATLDSVSEHGLEGATVRDIAARAGVTGGLIRHYFSGKDEMIQTAYREMLAGMTGTAVDAMAEAGDDPRRRLHDFIVANVSPPIADPKALSLWAAFVGRVRSDEELARIHRENYLIFIGILQGLVDALLTACQHKPAFSEGRHLAVAINGLIDGLWLENSLASDLFDERRLSDIALDAVEALLGGLSLRDGTLEPSCGGG
ncbi:MULTISPECIES: TetR family transcriptional regulator C-terminal domain-containing protein [Rhizobiaceae]|uniref:TetR family transcriptional regulator C-terminal domain-containing protein n=2 Tax=Rhizobiaceae TaxID=82115 RepID=A0ABT0D3C4_9HYPH|nr:MULTISPECIES: TetR family transcriptional regulator C-terminal domain-containing protein [unclassified Rhizobium]MCC8933050.1 TetR family transcriptional regulator C-terminal domain-containing protein [Rhizobium sp. 'Codium 1']MCJ8239907.1 TetR family transcriptional regulator C-terminal domain-containing protein [Rhizobium sp. SSM4.3]